MRVRKIGNRGSTTKVIGKFPSLKMGKTVWFESQIERDFIYLLEFDGDVLFYQEQPEKINYVRDDKGHSYTPDFLVRRRGGEQLVEVKPEARRNDEENVLLFGSVAPIIRAQGREFLVVSDEKIRVQPRLNNIKLLWRYARVPIVPQHQILCQELLGMRQQVSFTEAIHLFENNGVTRDVVYALLYRGVLATDLMQPLNASAPVYLPSTVLVSDRKVS
jgi:hypothetical protein